MYGPVNATSISDSPLGDSDVPTFLVRPPKVAKDLLGDCYVGSFRIGVPYLAVLIIRILLFSVLY